MAQLEGIELLMVLVVIGLLIVLSVRLRVRGQTVVLLIIIGFLLLALISLGKTVMTLMGIVVVLLISLIVLVFRQWFADKLLGGRQTASNDPTQVSGGFADGSLC